MSSIEAAGRSERWRAAIVAVVALGLVLWPLSKPREDDSFPLSNFPMFTADTPRVTSFYRALGVGNGGTESVLPAELVGGTVEVVQAARALSTAVSNGSIDRLCTEIAARTASARPGVERIDVVHERYDVVDALRADVPQPVSRTVVTTCPVPR